MARTEVIIPYYQRDPHHLTRALRSVFDQGVDDIRIHVIDDGSPRAARLDMSELTCAERRRINLVEQKNAGATAARNKGLSKLGKDAELVAFLDSDDVWLQGHLQRAEQALSQDSVTLFYDGVEPDDTLTEQYLPVSKILPADEFLRRADPAEQVEISHPLSVMCGEWFRHMHLSVTVLRADLARKLRFDPAFKLAEDFEFFCQCARQPGRWIADDRPGVRRGRGENLWQGAETSDERYSREKFYSMWALTRLAQKSDLSPELEKRVRERIQLYREQFYWAQRDRMKAGRSPNLGLWASFLARDPALAGFAWSRLTNRPAPKAGPNGA